MQCTGRGECLQHLYDGNGKVHYVCVNTPPCCGPVKCPICSELLPQAFLDLYDGKCLSCSVKDYMKVTPQKKAYAFARAAAEEGRFWEIPAGIFGRHKRELFAIRQAKIDSTPITNSEGTALHRWIVTRDTITETETQKARYPGAYVTEPRKSFPGYKGEETVIIHDSGSRTKMSNNEFFYRRLADGCGEQTGFYKIDGLKYRVAPKRVIIISNKHPCEIYSDATWQGMACRYNLPPKNEIAN